MAFVGISTTYGNVKVEDIIQDKSKIDSNLDVLGANYSLAQMETIKDDLLAIINTLQAQVDEQQTNITYLEERLQFLTTPP
jgi:hypothetical protein